MKASTIRKKVQSLANLIRNKDDATKYFDKQKNALEGIRNTEGLQEIKAYWLREYDHDAGQIANCDAKELGKVARYQAGMAKARSFLERLDNMTE